MKESTLILIPRNDEEYELFLETAERLKQEEPAIDASPPKDVKIASLNDELYDRTYKKYILDNKCSNGKKPKIVYQHHSGPFVMDGGSITYYYCKAEDETFIASFSGLAQVWEYYLYQGNICKT